MLDNLLSTVKRGAERVQRRGEEVAQVARLKMEVFQLGRELDGHYARLGRSYHAGADLDLLQQIRADIQQAEDDIRARERLIEELGGQPDEHTEQGEDQKAQTGLVAVTQPGVGAAAAPAASSAAAVAPQASVPNTDNAPNFISDSEKEKPAG